MLKGYTPDDYYYEFAKFVPYLLDDAVIGTVYCAPAMTGYDDAGLLPFIAAAASNTTVLADGFADFLPTAAVGFRYEDVLTWKQVNTVSLTCHWVFPLNFFISCITLLLIFMDVCKQSVYTLGHSAGSEAVEHNDVLSAGGWP